MKTFLGFIGLAWAAASLLSAQEYKIQMHRPAKAGQEFDLSFQYQVTHRISASFMGKTAPERRTNLVAELGARVKVLEAGPGGRITRASCVVSNCARLEGKVKHELLAPESVINAAARDGQPEFLVNGRPVEPELQMLLFLALELDPSGKAPTTDDVFGTATPKKIGESWDFKPEALAAVLQRQALQVDPADMEGRTTLEQVVKVGDVECLELASKVYLKKFKLPMLQGIQGVQTTFAFGALRTSGKYPLDTSLGALEESLDMNVDIAVQAKTGAAAQGVTSKTSHTIKSSAQRRYLK